MYGRAKVGELWRDIVLEYICKITAPGGYFNSEELRQYYPEMSARKPANPFVAEKVRQQLQILRDRGIVQFLSPGSYKRLK